jgi:AraC-like DNA-binding protein
MVAAAVSPSADRVAVARGQIDAGRKERVRQAVRRHLRTPTPVPTNLCRLVGMSRSNLYRLFEDTGGVARYIRRERLLEAHEILTDPTTTESISAIAEDLCFADASSFSRTFKREFGHSPGEMRAATLARLALPAMPRDPVPSSAGVDSTSCFADSGVRCSSLGCGRGPHEGTMAAVLIGFRQQDQLHILQVLDDAP